MRRIPTLLIAIAALALAGCGGGDDKTIATSSSSPTTAQQGGGDSGQGGSGQQGSGGGREPLDTSSLPEPEEGSEKAAPGVPVSKGGDNSIQTWGLEASADERAEVTAILQAFLDARAYEEEAQIDYVLSLRVGEGHAFLIYTRPDTNKIYANALREEDGTWKVVSVGPTVLS